MNATKTQSWKTRVAEMVRDVTASVAQHYAESDAPLFLFYQPARNGMWGCLWATSDLAHAEGTLASSQAIPDTDTHAWLADVVADLPVVGCMD